MKFDFGNPETSIQEISNNSSDYIDKLYSAGCELADAEAVLRQRTAEVSLKVRDSGVKVTEGYVSSVIDGDTELNELKVKVDKIKIKVSCIRQDLESVHDDRRLLEAWYNAQSKAGIMG